MDTAVMIPLLPSPDIDVSVRFYEALGFERTYRQTRPNPYAVVERGAIQVHMFGMENFDPANSYGSVLIAVPDLDPLYESFAAGLRASYGKLPSSGIPRILRPRKRFGTVRGFSVVDPGGNWLRFSRMGDTEEAAKQEKTTGLARVVQNAARQGDARGHDGDALQVLDAGLARFPDAPPADRVRALLYRAELGVRLGDRGLARDALAAAAGIELSAEERAALDGDFTHAAELVRDLS